jgi:hypothetical protein
MIIQDKITEGLIKLINEIYLFSKTEEMFLIVCLYLFWLMIRQKPKL